MNADEITQQGIYKARRTISHVARKTPLIQSPALSERAGRPVYLKYEGFQETGSFKIRGAANKLLNLTEEEKAKGVIAFSTGNHGRAVAYVARSLGVRCLIYLSNRVPDYRVQAMRNLGAEVVRHGSSQDEAYEEALRVRSERGLTMIAPFDDPMIIAGQGTIGLEILEDLPDLGAVLVPLSGGGLMSGVALAVKSANPAIRTLGISMEVAPAMYAGLKAGRPVEIEEKDSLADALLGGIGLDNRYTFPMVRQYVDDVALVSEDEIAKGMAFAFLEHRLAVEGAGAVGIAALLAGKAKLSSGPAAVVLSGGNVDASLLMDIVRKSGA
jgi:threonine dehydratase